MLAVYLRVSSFDQSHTSQRPEVERWLKGHGYDPADVDWYEDQETGKHQEREAFQKLQTAIFNGEVKTVVVWRLDRLGRTLLEGVNTVADWCDRGVRLVSVTQQLDMSNTVGKMIAAVLFGVAECELESMKTRQAAGIAVAKSRGTYQGGKSGRISRFRNVPGREEKIDVIREAAALRQKGNSKSHIGRYLGLSANTVKKYLRLAADEGLISEEQI